MEKLHDLNDIAGNLSPDGFPRYSEAMLFTPSKKWAMIRVDMVVSPVRTPVGEGENSYSAIRRQISTDCGISVGRGAVIFTGFFSEPEGERSIIDIWVFRLKEEDEELISSNPWIRLMSSDEIKDSFEEGSFSDMGETEKLRSVFTIYETPVCVDF